MKRRWAFLAAVAAIIAVATAAWQILIPFDDSARESGVTIRIRLEGARDETTLIREPDSSYIYLLQGNDGTTQRLTPDEFAQRLYQQGAYGGWINTLLNVSNPAGVAWVCLGLLGQLLFTARMAVQWLVSERHKNSVVPPAFWWLSLIGASMLLAYFLWRRDAVGVLGQGFGWIVYLRNLHLLYFGSGRVTAAVDPAPEPELVNPVVTARPERAP